MTRRIPPLSHSPELQHLGLPTGCAESHSGEFHPAALPLVWQPDIQSAMERSCLGAYPGEGCGFLLGRDADGHRTLSVALEVDNRAGEDQLRRFQMTPRDFMKAERHAASLGLEVLGIYHSHPDHRAIPSTHDLVGAWPHLSYVILAVDGSTTKPQVVETRSWQLNDAHLFSEEPLRNLN
jgi:proteasome lid subunit RPN8/RPN11